MYQKNKFQKSKKSEVFIHFKNKMFESLTYLSKILIKNLLKILKKLTNIIIEVPSSFLVIFLY